MNTDPETIKWMRRLTALKLTITTLRRLRDSKPELWDQIVDPEICDLWDFIKLSLGDDDPKLVREWADKREREIKYGE